LIKEVGGGPPRLRNARSDRTRILLAGAEKTAA